MIIVLCTFYYQHIISDKNNIDELYRIRLMLSGIEKFYKGVENYLDFRLVLLEDHPTLVGWNPLGNTTILKSRAMASVVKLHTNLQTRGTPEKSGHTLDHWY